MRGNSKRLLINLLAFVATMCLLMSTTTIVAFASTEISKISVKTEKNDWEQENLENPKVESGSSGRYTILADSIVWNKNVSECKPGDTVKVTVRLVSNEGYVFDDSLSKRDFSIQNGEYRFHKYTEDGNIELTFDYRVRGILDAPEDVYWDGTSSKPGRIRWSKVSSDATYTVKIYRGNNGETVADGITSTTYDLTPYLKTTYYFERDNVYVKVKAVPKDKVKSYLKASDYAESDYFWDWDEIDFNPYGPKPTPNPPEYDYNRNTWQLINGIWYWYDNNGQYARNEFKDINGERYYFMPDGRMVTGWQYISNRWYFFNGSGAMLRSTWYDDGVNWYYLENDGKMKTGWFNWNMNWYYLTESGAMARGWIKIGNDWYYFHPGGNMATNVFVRSADGLIDFYMQSNGIMQTGWIYQNGWKYIEPNSGSHQKGWLTLNGVTYFLEPTTATMVTGNYCIDGVWHYFSESGAMLW